MLPLLGVGAAAAVGGTLAGVATDWLSQYFTPKYDVNLQNTNAFSLASYLTGGYNFYVKILAPTNDDIMAIDDFFTAYGYRIDRFINPDLGAREVFTYIKTRDANVKSHVYNAAEQMRALLNNGCRFWNGGIGDVDNIIGWLPLSEEIK